MDYSKIEKLPEFQQFETVFNQVCQFGHFLLWNELEAIVRDVGAEHPIYFCHPYLCESKMAYLFDDMQEHEWLWTVYANLFNHTLIFKVYCHSKCFRFAYKVENKIREVLIDSKDSKYTTMSTYVYEYPEMNLEVYEITLFSKYSTDGRLKYNILESINCNQKYMCEDRVDAISKMQGKDAPIVCVSDPIDKSSSRIEASIYLFGKFEIVKIHDLMKRDFDLRIQEIKLERILNKSFTTLVFRNYDYEHDVFK